MRPSIAALCLGFACAGPPYELREEYVGLNFFKRWDFWSDDDPSGGSVEYVDESEAVTEGLVRATASGVYIGVDSLTVTTNTTGRKSIRIQSKDVYNSGLFVAEIGHVPTGCGTWPAFWLYGEDADHPWPQWGEYDIVEGIHNQRRTMTSLHSGADCLQSSVLAGEDFSGDWELGAQGRFAADCDVNAEGQFHNQGCSQSGPEDSMGSAFNSGGGGTFAAEWDSAAGHMRTWFWRHGRVPANLASQEPDPESWGRPYSYFRLDERCPARHFRNMRLVLNINLCGELGAPMFASSCPEAAKTMTCQEFVSDPSHMREVYWTIRRLDVYQHPPRAAPPPTPNPDGPPIFFLADGDSHGPGQTEVVPEFQHRPLQGEPTGARKEDADRSGANGTSFAGFLRVVELLVIASGIAGLVFFTYEERQRHPDQSNLSALTAVLSRVVSFLQVSIGWLGSSARRCKENVNVTEVLGSRFAQYADRLDALLDSVGQRMGWSSESRRGGADLEDAARPLQRNLEDDGDSSSWSQWSWSRPRGRTAESEPSRGRTWSGESGQSTGQSSRGRSSSKETARSSRDGASSGEVNRRGSGVTWLWTSEQSPSSLEAVDSEEQDPGRAAERGAPVGKWPWQ